MSARVTIVVVTRNRRASLLVTLDRLGALPSPTGQARVIVVDNGSTDGTVSAVTEHFPRVTVVPLSGNWGSAARNVGVALAGTPYVAFSDDDSWWAASALESSVAILDGVPGIGLLAARVLVGPQERIDAVCEVMSHSPLGAFGFPGPRIRGFVACGCVVRRSAFLEVGGFHPRMGIGGEEELLAVDLVDAGWELVYVDDVVAHHHPSPIRDPSARRRAIVRNRLWSLWLRRSYRSCLPETGRLLAGGWRDPGTWRGAADAVRGIRWVRRERRPVDPSVERDLVLVESVARSA
jgi:GT2 family glycosyltransferase